MPPASRSAPAAGSPVAPPRRLVTVAQAAEHASVSPRTIRRWISSGLIARYRLGPRLVRVNLDDLDQLIEQIPMPKPDNEDAA